MIEYNNLPDVKLVVVSVLLPNVQLGTGKFECGYLIIFKDR